MKTENTLTPTKNILDFFLTINKKGGPDISDYYTLTKCIDSIPELLRHGVISNSDIEMLISQCEYLNVEKSIMGHIKIKPLGYAGDYQIIEKVYQKEASEKYLRWDLFTIDNPAAEAVRNRKEFFKTLILEKLQQQEHIHLLNIASGPARDLKELYDVIDPQRLKTTCIEIDNRAIEYAELICGQYYESIKFINQNIFTYETDEKFDIIWSAGLFDYFNDRTFVRLLRRLQRNLKETGEICIGNFSKNNPHQTYMEIFGEWFLSHRSEEELTELAILAGADPNEIKVDHEPLKINLFLRTNNKFT